MTTYSPSLNTQFRFILVVNGSAVRGSVCCGLDIDFKLDSGSSVE